MLMAADTIVFSLVLWSVERAKLARSVSSLSQNLSICCKTILGRLIRFSSAFSQQLRMVLGFRQICQILSGNSEERKKELYVVVQVIRHARLDFCAPSTERTLLAGSFVL